MIFLVNYPVSDRVLLKRESGHWVRWKPLGIQKKRRFWVGEVCRQPLMFFTCCQLFRMGFKVQRITLNEMHGLSSWVRGKMSIYLPTYVISVKFTAIQANKNSKTLLSVIFNNLQYYMQHSPFFGSFRCCKRYFRKSTLSLAQQELMAKELSTSLAHLTWFSKIRLEALTPTFMSYHLATFTFKKLFVIHK